jgi:hypothetical protein
MAKKTTEPTRRQKWAPYVREIADRLALKDWVIDVDDDGPKDQSAHASIWIAHGRKRATIYLSDEFLADSRPEQRQSIAHELIHVHNGPYWDAVSRATDDDKNIRMLMEYSVDGLADGVAPLLPLPPKI